MEKDLLTNSTKIYKIPSAKYFIFDEDYLYLGSVSIREDGDKTLTKFYKYKLE